MTGDVFATCFATRPVSTQQKLLPRLQSQRLDLQKWLLHSLSLAKRKEPFSALTTRPSRTGCLDGTVEDPFKRRPLLSAQEFLAIVCDYAGSDAWHPTIDDCPTVQDESALALEATHAGRCLAGNAMCLIALAREVETYSTNE